MLPLEENFVFFFRSYKTTSAHYVRPQLGFGQTMSAEQRYIMYCIRSPDLPLLEISNNHVCSQLFLLLHYDLHLPA